MCYDACVDYLQICICLNIMQELNAVVRGMSKAGALAVLSFSEGKPTRLSYVSTQIVPHESAYPGYECVINRTTH
jgi:hypothetical protein